MGAINLGVPFNPKALYLYRPVDNRNGRLHHGDHTICVEAPFGDLLNIPVGTLLLDDMPVPSVDTVEVSIQVGFGIGSSHSTTRSELEAQGLLPPLQGAAAVESRVGDAYWYVCDCLDGPFRRVLLPATALFACYFAPTSRLANRILAGDLRELEPQFVDRNKTKPIDAGGHAHITFRTGVLTAEVLPLARAWYDPAYAKRYEEIHTYSAIQTRSKQPTFLRCEPPVSGTFQLRVEGIVSRTTRSPERDLIVLRILASNEALPFLSLQAHLDQTTGNHQSNSGLSGEPVAGSKPPPQGDFLAEFLALSAPATPPAKGQPLVVTLSTQTTSFEGLTNKFEIVRRKRTGGGDRTGMIPPVDTERNTTERGNAGGDEKTRVTDLSHFGRIQIDRKDDEVTDHVRSPQEAFEAILSAVDHMSETLGIQISAKRVTPKGRIVRGVPLNEVATDIPGRAATWVYLSEDTSVPRQIILFEMSRSGRFLYLLEIIRRPGETFSTLVFGRVDSKQIADSSLLSVIREVDRVQRFPSELDVRSLAGDPAPREPIEAAAERGWARRIKHSYGTSDTFAQRLAGKLLVG